jgi:hypothetical protein
MKSCETCTKPITLPKGRGREWLDRARFCSRRCWGEARRKRPIAERFWEKVKRSGPDECWLWVGARDTNGYGRFTVANGQTAIASRLAYELTHGAIESRSIMVRHRCDNPPCCNPAHLVRGLAIDNEHDKMERGRNRKALGEAASKAKLTTADVRLIRLALGRKLRNQSELARQLGVGSAAISSIARGETWRHVA